MAKRKSVARKLNRIAEVLEEQGKTQAWLAGELEKEYRTINRYANNHRQPSLEILYQIARILKISPRMLIYE